MPDKRSFLTKFSVQINWWRKFPANLALGSAGYHPAPIELPNEHPMKPAQLVCIPCVAAFALLTSTSYAVVVFADDFSEPDGTEIIGKAPDVGSAWTGSAPTISGSSFDTTGAGRGAYANFTVPLAAGQSITLTYDTLELLGNNFFSGGYAGVSLFVGGSEQVFTGDTGGAAFWGVDQPAVGGANISTDATAVTSATFQYAYDTGAWSFTTASGVSMSGIGVAGAAFDRLRVANGNGGDIRIDNLSVDISAVPEPGSLALLGFSILGLGMRRRRN